MADHTSGADNSGTPQDENERRVGDRFPWEVAELRCHLPPALRTFLGIDASILAVPINVRNKIIARHPGDASLLERIDEFFAGWEIAGVSPKGEGRLEVYGRIDQVWRVAVVVHNASAGINLLVTMHRIDARKVRSRERKGYLARRGESG